VGCDSPADTQSPHSLLGVMLVAFGWVAGEVPDNSNAWTTTSQQHFDHPQPYNGAQHVCATLRKSNVATARECIGKKGRHNQAQTCSKFVTEHFHARASRNHRLQILFLEEYTKSTFDIVGNLSHDKPRTADKFRHRLLRLQDLTLWPGKPCAAPFTIGSRISRCPSNINVDSDDLPGVERSVIRKPVAHAYVGLLRQVSSIFSSLTDPLVGTWLPLNASAHKYAVSTA